MVRLPCFIVQHPSANGIKRKLPSRKVPATKGSSVVRRTAFGTTRIRADGVRTNEWLPLDRDRCKSGQQVEVFVSPANPSQIVMEPSHEVRGLRHLQLIGVFLMLGTPLAWFFLRQRWNRVDVFGKPVGGVLISTSALWAHGMLAQKP